MKDMFSALRNKRLRQFITYLSLLVLLFTLSACESEKIVLPETKQDYQASLVILNSISFEGLALDPPFASDQLLYNASVSFDVNNVALTPVSKSSLSITLNDNIVESGEKISNYALEEGENVITIIISETKEKEEDNIKKTYVFTIDRAVNPSPPIFTDDADLSTLTFSSGELIPPFSTTIQTYNLVLENVVEAISVTPFFVASSKVSINNVSILSDTASEDFPINVGYNTLNLVVTAGNEATKQYTINAIRFASNTAPVRTIYDANLLNLETSAGQLSPAFSTEILEYTLTIDSAIPTINITSTASNPSASQTLNGSMLLSGKPSASLILNDFITNPITLVVTAEDQTTTTTFTIRITTIPNPNLSALSLSFGALDQLFQETQTSYTANIGYLADTLNVIATPADASANLTINNIPTPNSTESSDISLLEGSNAVDIVVTARDAETNKTYSIDITRNDVASVLQKHYIKPEDIMNSPIRFGSAIALDGRTLVIGADSESSATIGVNGDPFYDCTAETVLNCSLNSGAVYVFTYANETWVQTAYLKASNAQSGDKFGYSVALDGDVLVVGAPLSLGSGTAYIYRYVDGNWIQAPLLMASNAESDDRFGSSVDISGNTIIVGAPGESAENTDESNNNALLAGAAYVFLYDENKWGQQAYIKASNADSNDAFGTAVTLSNDTAVIGAPGESSNAIGINNAQDNNEALNSGATYVFNRNETNWTQSAYIKASNTGATDAFGHNLTLDNHTLAVSSRNGVGGSAYVFLRNDAGLWTQQASIQPSTPNEDGTLAVSLSGNMLALGSPTENSAATGINNTSEDFASHSGAAYLFKRTDNTWTQTLYIKAANTEVDDQFGQSIAVQGETLIVTAPNEDSADPEDMQDNTQPQAGAVYVFQ